MKPLLSALNDIPEYRSLLAAIDNGACPAAFSGLSAVHRAHFAAGIRQELNRPVVVVCADEGEAERMARDLAALSGEAVRTLSAREFTFHNAAVVSRQYEHRRLSTLRALAAGECPLLVCTVESILQRTIPKTLLTQAAQVLRMGERHDLGELAGTLAAAGYTRCEQVEGVGVGVPGPVLDSRIVPIVCANLGGWGERNVSIQLSGLLDGMKVLVGNDANVAALGEIWMGCAKGCRSAVMVTLGTGVGGGVIVNGRIIEGVHGAGGEIGHITVNPHETAVCGCGKHGCLEQYSSATGVVRCMKKLLDENPDTPCTLRGTDFAAKDVFDAARAGDALAAREVDEMTDTLGMALASIASTTDPEMFMVGGGVARAGDVLFNPLREHFKTYAFSSCRETHIVAATLGNDAGIYGAVRLIVGE